jgi:hypothetical protein
MQGQNRLNQYMSVTEDLLQVYKDGDKFLDLVDLVEKDSDYRFMIKDTKGLSSLLTLDDEILQSSFGSLSSVGYVPSNNDLGELGGWFVKGPSLLAYQLGHEGVQDILSHSDFDRVGRIVYDKDYEGKFDFSDLGLLHAFTQDERLLRKYVSRDRDEMYEDVMTKLNRKSESKREVRDGFYSSLQDIRFVNSLSNTDLFKIEMLLDYLSSQNNVDAIHDNLMVDMADTTTEHGGQIVYDNGVRMNYIDAAKSENDGEYVIGEDFLDTVPYSLTDFHNHALPHDNTSFSGSSGAGLLGGGDLGVARKYQRDGVVFTLLNDDKFNVDFYTPQGYEVDLGVYERK